MRQRTSDNHYLHYISEIAYRNNFSFYKEEGQIDVIWKVANSDRTPIVTSEEFPRNALWFYAWKKLREEYGEEFAFGKPKNSRRA